jgi:hypothetical protein
MDRLKETLSGKKKRHTVGVTDGQAFQQALDEEGKVSSPAPSRLNAVEGKNSPAVARASTASPSPQRTDSKGKFATMMGKAKDKLATSLRASPSPGRKEDRYSSGDVGRFEVDGDVPAPTLNFANYGQTVNQRDNDAGSDDDDMGEEKPPVPAIEAPYIEDDPSLTVLFMAKATYDYGAQEASEMEMVAGDRIAVYSFEPDRWGKGRNLRTRQRGEFPCNRTNVAEASRNSSAAAVPPRKPMSPGVAAAVANGSGSMPSPQMQRIAVAPGTPVVGSPQVQRLAFFDNLNQDIAYQQQKQARGGAPQYVEVFVDPHDPTRNHNASAPPSISVIAPSEPPAAHAGGGGSGDRSHSTPPHSAHPVQPPPQPNRPGGATSPGRRPLPAGPNSQATHHAKGTASPIVGSPQVQRLAFFDNLNKDIAQQERRKSGAVASGPVVQKIVASEEDYPMDERGTE